MTSTFLYCEDCGSDVKRLLEFYYKVKDEVWRKVARPDEVLCVYCLEKRLERKLRVTDFTDDPINKRKKRLKSALLLNRLENADEENKNR